MRDSLTRYFRYKGGRLYHVIDERRQPENGRFIVAAPLCRASGETVAHLMDGIAPPAEFRRCVRCTVVQEESSGRTDRG